MSGPTLVRTPTQTTEWRTIHDGLRKLWKACLPDQDGGDVARSLTINFVAVADAADAPALAEATARLQNRSPCRAFLLLVDEAADPGRAELAATTRCHGSTRDIVLEEIILRVPPRAFAQVPGLVRPLLMNDLPNHLFWAKAWPTDERALDAVASMCEHIVVDSRSFADPVRDLAALAARRAKGAKIADLNWQRLSPWRRALAEAFERVVWKPGTPTTGSLRHGAGATAAAHLLAGWLSERLGAQLQLERGGDAAAACPEAVVLRTGEFEIDLAVLRQQLRVHVSTPAHCYLPFSVPLSRSTDGDLLASAIALG